MSAVQFRPQAPYSGAPSRSRRAQMPNRATVAQLEEQLTRNEQVRGSSPRGGSRRSTFHSDRPEVVVFHALSDLGGGATFLEWQL